MPALRGGPASAVGAIVDLHLARHRDVGAIFGRHLARHRDVGAMVDRHPARHLMSARFPADIWPVTVMSARFVDRHPARHLMSTRFSADILARHRDVGAIFGRHFGERGVRARAAFKSGPKPTVVRSRTETGVSSPIQRPETIHSPSEGALDRPHDVFISYNSQDQDAALELDGQLRTRGYKPWIEGRTETLALGGSACRRP